MKKIRKNSKVIVFSGKDKGKQGLVLAMLGERVVVEGVNKVKKHIRPNPSKGIQGGIIEKNMPIHISNLRVIN